MVLTCHLHRENVGNEENRKEIHCDSQGLYPLPMTLTNWAHWAKQATKANYPIVSHQLSSIRSSCTTRRQQRDAKQNICTHYNYDAFSLLQAYCLLFNALIYVFLLLNEPVCLLTDTQCHFLADNFTYFSPISKLFFSSWVVGWAQWQTTCLIKIVEVCESARIWNVFFQVLCARV